MVHIGADLHRSARSSPPSTLTERSSSAAASPAAPTRPARLRRAAAQPIEVAFEATVGWGWFADLLADAGVPAHMAHPLATQSLAGSSATRPPQRCSRAVQAHMW